MVSIPNIKHLICLLSASRYLTNPRYLLLVPGPGGEEEEGEGGAPVVVVVSLMQKNRRQMYDEGEDQLLIGFEVFEVDIIVEVVFTQCATPGGGAGGGALLALCSEGGAHCAAGGGRALPAGGGAVYLHISTYLHIYISTVYAQVRDSVPRPHGGGAGAGEGRG